MKKFEIIKTGTRHPRLTVSKDRVTIKLPDDILDDQQDKVINFLCAFADEIGDPEKTLRGVLEDGRIRMRENRSTKTLFRKLYANS